MTAWRESDPLLTLVSGLPDILQPDDASTRLRARAHTVLARQRRRGRLKSRVLRVVTLVALVAISMAYLGRAAIRAVELFRSL
jgi:hypothetical protein